MTSSQPTDYMWHSFYAVINALPKIWPYRHLVIDRFLHPALFKALVTEGFGSHLVQRNDPARITHAPEGQRFNLVIDSNTDLATLQTQSLRDLWGTLTDARLCELLMQKFADEVAKRHGPARPPHVCGIEVIEDRTGYALQPHVDARQKMVTVLIYLAEPGADESLGTSLYVPDSRPETPDEAPLSFAYNARLPRERFAVAATVPYRPNTALIFAPGDNTFHGVEEVAAGTSRRLIQFQINRAGTP